MSQATISIRVDETLKKSFDSLCDEFGWVPVSMKNDWTTIYGDGVNKK